MGFLKTQTCNFTKKRLHYRCFSVNFAKFLRAPFSQNTSRRRFLFSSSQARNLKHSPSANLYFPKTIRNFTTKIWVKFVIFINLIFRQYLKLRNLRRGYRRGLIHSHVFKLMTPFFVFFIKSFHCFNVSLTYNSWVLIDGCSPFPLKTYFC